MHDVRLFKSNNNNNNKKLNIILKNKANPGGFLRRKYLRVTAFAATLAL